MVKSRPNGREPSPRLTAIVTVFLSGVTLLLEFAQTKLFSFIAWHHFVYIVVTIGLIGYAAGGAILYARPSLRTRPPAEFFGWGLLLFGLAAYFSSKVAPWPIRSLFGGSPDIRTMLRLGASCAIAMPPYVLSGLMLSRIFSDAKQSKGKLYFANLAGSAAGCLVFVYLIGFLGGGWLIAASGIAALAFVPPVVHGDFERRRLGWAAVGAAVLIAIAEGSGWTDLTPEAHKQFCMIFGDNTVVEKTLWNPITRIDVISAKNNPEQKHILMDGDAEAALFNDRLAQILYQRDVRAAAYEMMGRAADRVLLIGAGGGLDTRQAYSYGVRQIDAVEINPSTYRLIREDYKQQLDGLFSRPNIHLFLEDGRAFVRGSTASYDVINLFATDSLVALSAGAYMMLDNYLYTREAFIDYLKHLSPDGFLQVQRWYNLPTPAESLRLFSTSLEALKACGAARPVDHIGLIWTAGWVEAVVKRSPLTDREKRTMLAYALAHGGHVLYPPDIADAAPVENRRPFEDLAAAFSQHAENGFYSAYSQAIFPVTDDSPFFYQFAKLGRQSQSGFIFYDAMRGVWHIFVLSALLVVSIVFCLAFVLLPVLLSHPASAGGRGFVSGYFLMIGLAFMLVEMGLIQKFVLFLGHPIYSMAVTMPALLGFAGLGSLVSDRWSAGLKRRIVAVNSACAVAVILTFAATSWLVPDLLRLPLPARIFSTILLLGPCAFAMGMPFPLGLRALPRSEQVGWAWAVNSSASVIASVLAIAIAMAYGFAAALAAASLCYASAALGAALLLNVATASETAGLALQFQHE